MERALDSIRLGPELERWQNLGMEKLRYDYDLKEDDKVLDVGSYLGKFADAIRARYKCQVRCFEALDNSALWTYDGMLELGGQFLYTSIHTKENVRKYQCFDAAKIITEELALVKINIEGGEYELIRYMIDKDLMKFVKNLQVQFHIVDGLNYRYLVMNN